MNLREQEYVLAIAKYQTLKSAAEFLNISSPTLSVFLSTLEQRLGVPLFHRFGKKFVPTEVVAVLSPLHPLAAQAEPIPGCPLPWLDLSRCAGETLILQRPDQSSRIFADRALAYAGISPTRVYILENLETAAQMAAEGLGIAFNFLGYIQYFSYPKPISFFPVGDPKALIDYYIVRRKDAYLAPQISDFIQILGKQMARHAPLVLPRGERGV